MFKVRTFFLLIAVFFILGLLSADQVLAEPKWLKQAMDSARSTVVDKDAPAFIIFDEVETEISKNGKAKSHVCFAAKVLALSGLEYANLTEVVHDAREIKNLKGWLINPEGEEFGHDKKHVAEVDIESAAGYYYDSRVLFAVFPQADIGDVVAYEYDMIEKEYWTSFNQSFVFQKDLPVLNSRFSVEIPEGWQVHESERNFDGVTKIVEENVHIWEAGFLPYRPEEPFMPDWADLTRRIDLTCYDPLDTRFKLFNDWLSVAAWILDKYDSANIVDDNIIATVEEFQTAYPGPDTDRLISEIAAYVRDQIRYVAVEIGEGRFVPRPAGKTMSNRFGDCKDKVTLMRAMLQAAGVSSAPVLASVGDMVISDFPSPFQFNHLIIGIPQSDFTDSSFFSAACIDGWLYYDPTDPTTSLGDLPLRLRGSQVFRVSESDPSLVALPSRSSDDYSRKYYADATVTPEHSIMAAVKIIDYGCRALESRYDIKIKSDKEWIEELQERFAQTMQNPKISGFESDFDKDSCWVSFDLEGDDYTSSAANLTMLKIDFFHSLESAEKPKEKRQHPISFGKPRQFDISISWQLPDGWYFESEPDSIEYVCEIAGLKSSAEIVDNLLKYNVFIEYKGGSLPATQFEEAYGFIKHRRKANNLTAIIKKM